MLSHVGGMVEVVVDLVDQQGWTNVEYGLIQGLSAGQEN
jgi:Flp pilus assembly pilin Flp